MDSSEGIVKSVDGIYKNILEKFNPGAKTLITNGKAYLKALHNSSAASKVFIESLAKLAVNAHEGGGGTSDIGKALMDLVGVFSSIEDQHMNVLKAFYCDFILPLENNIEKDTKVVQLEQKKFSQFHKQRVEAFNKATSNMKKHRKKKNNAEKELKCIQALEEEKKLLDNFCEQSIKNALIQERRRYGFVLERCVQSMAKHWSQYFDVGHSTIENNLDWWNETASTREMLPMNAAVEPATVPRKPSEPRDLISSAYDDYGSVKSAMRKSQSVHASTGSLGGAIAVAHENDNTYQMSRHLSQHSLASSPPPSKASNSSASLVTAIYPYLSSGENQLSFYEGDKILVIGEKTQGWQFGENLRTNVFGWFPISYVMSESERKTNNDAANSENSRSTLRRNQEENHHRDSYQKIENPPMELPPPPPKGSEPLRVHGSATTNFSKTVPNGGHSDNANKPSLHGIYSSNDSGFDNEVPPAPEVDYSDDDDLPKKIPIRDPDSNANAQSENEDNHENYSKSPMNLKQSSSFGNLTDSNRTLEHGYNLADSTTIKRNKSFWRFSKSEDILEGMALWKHRDLVPIERSAQLEKEMTLKKSEKPNKKMETLQKKTSRMEETPRKMDKRGGSVGEFNSRPKSYNENYKDQLMHRNGCDEIYDESPKRRNNDGMTPKQSKSQSQKAKYEKNKNYSREIQDTNFYDDDSQMVIKTVKRKEILKQYYSSGTDTELSSSDPYDCIIVDDHLVPTSTSTFRNRNSYAAGDDRDKRGSLYSRSNKNDSVSGTLLPRTKLTKRAESNEFDFNTTRSNKTLSKSNWSNMWPDE